MRSWARVDLLGVIEALHQLQREDRSSPRGRTVVALITTLLEAIHRAPAETFFRRRGAAQLAIRPAVGFGAFFGKKFWGKLGWERDSVSCHWPCCQSFEVDPFRLPLLSLLW